MCTEIGRAKRSLQKSVSHGQHSTGARFAASLCMHKLGKPLTSKESLKKTYVVVVRNL